MFGPTPAAGYAVWVMLIASYGCMYGMLPWLGERLGVGARPGLLAGLAGALLPRLPGYVEAPAAVAIGPGDANRRGMKGLPRIDGDGDGSCSREGVCAARPVW